jgi:hypothetical protein
LLLEHTPIDNRLFGIAFESLRQHVPGVTLRFKYQMNLSGRCAVSR